jgi:hypothetical protein
VHHVAVIARSHDHGDCTVPLSHVYCQRNSLGRVGSSCFHFVSHVHVFSIDSVVSELAPAFDLKEWLSAVDARLARFEAQIRDGLFVESFEDLVLIKEAQFENIGIAGAILNKLMHAVAAAKVLK